MYSKKLGRQSVLFPHHPAILGTANIVGPMEGHGPLGTCFDTVMADTYDGEETWEKTECKMVEHVMREAVRKAGVPIDSVDYVLAGDLLNQLISSNYAARQIARPFIGLYGACSTMALSMIVAGMFLEGDFGGLALCCASSHHNTAERQYRMPTEHGNQRAMSSQWTVTGSGSVLLGMEKKNLFLSGATVGKVLDFGENDVNNMGAAMAPAVADTILVHFHDFRRKPEDYDLILTGDLGILGLQMLKQLLSKEGIQTDERFQDCGALIYAKDQDAHMGGSGCGCSAVVLTGHILPRLERRELGRILFIGSGSLHSTVSVGQGESLPGIGHAVVIERVRE